MEQFRRILIALLLLGAAVAAFRSVEYQTGTWAGPYFSGASNFELGSPTLVSRSELLEFIELSPSDQLAYHFKGGDSEEYRYTEIGYLYIAVIARALFSWFSGDMMAVIILQVIVHFAVTLSVASLLKPKWGFWAFVVGYGCNPLVIRFVTFNFYYFWLVLPGFVLIRLLFRKTDVKTAEIVLYGLLLALSLLVRTTSAPLILLCFVVAFMVVKNLPKAITFVGVALLTFGLLWQKTDRNVWHTVYIGVGAYENPHMKGLTDLNGYSLMETKTGVKIDGGHPDSLMFESETAEKYQSVLKTEWEKIFAESPFLLARNALANLGQAYSVGHIANSGRDYLSFAIALSGFVFALVMLKFRLWTLFLGIGLGSAYTLFYPPIPAYMFGNYILLVVGGIEIVRIFLNEKRAKKCYGA